MDITVTTEHRFQITNDGSLWTQTGFGNDFWQRYLDVFDNVFILARAQNTKYPLDGAVKVNGNNIFVIKVPYYIGPYQYSLNIFSVRKTIIESLKNRNAILLRIGSQIASVLYPKLEKLKRPYGVEVVGDPADVFSKGAGKYPLRPLVKWYFVREQRKLCRNACCGSYVTQYTLQRKYPLSDNMFSTYYSSIVMPSNAYIMAARKNSKNERMQLICVGTLAQMYKGTDVLIDAFSICIRDGFDLGLIIVGDGKYRMELQSRAAKLGVEDRVVFRGSLTFGEAVRNELDKADIFVLPSRQEGLPRAMIEAMARGLPCIGTKVGGIPELLNEKYLVEPGNSKELAQKIKELVVDPNELEKASEGNLKIALNYHSDELRKRRNIFYSHLKMTTERYFK